MTEEEIATVLQETCNDPRLRRTFRESIAPDILRVPSCAVGYMHAYIARQDQAHFVAAFYLMARACGAQEKVGPQDGARVFMLLTPPNDTRQNRPEAGRLLEPLGVMVPQIAPAHHRWRHAFYRRRRSWHPAV